MKKPEDVSTGYGIHDKDAIKERRKKIQERSMQKTVGIEVPQTEIAAEILFRTYGAGSHKGFKIHNSFFKEGIITDEAKELILEAFKKNSHAINITPALMEDLPNIIVKYMEKLGYGPTELRNRILSLQRGRQK